MANIYDMVDTWNAGATTFTAIKMNVTDTASAAGSALMDLQLAGTTILRLQKNGLLQFGGTTSSFPALRASGPNLEVRRADNGDLGNLVAMGAYLGNGGVLALGNDTVLVRDAADALAQRRTTNPQAFRIYNTFTDASNYERGFFEWSANVFEIGTLHNGTGTARVMRLKTGAGVGIRFATTSTDRWEINGNGHFAASTDNTYDIGASGANRPRNVFVAGSITAGPAISTANDAGVVTWGASNDVILTRDAASVLAQRNSTNPQAFRVYNTFTDSSNYERGFFRYASNALEIGHEGLGTGAVTPRTVSLWANGTRYFMVGGDIGAWNINTNSHLVCGLDNTRDIGTPGANRPRNVFVGNRVEASGDVIAGGTSDIQLSGRFRLRSAGDGIIALYNNAATNFNRLQFGGTSNAFPSIKRSGTGIDFRLADDSAFTGIGAASVSVDASTTARPHFALTAGVAPTSPANGDIWFDGTDMKIRIGGVTKTFTII